MDDAVARALAYAKAARPGFVAQLKDFVRIPSVSADPRHAADVRRCADWLARDLRRIGMPRVRVIATPRNPIVYADWLGAPGRPTVLIYGHYDVQPADPPDAWRTPPFEPTVRGDDLFGRGASDDKGPLFAHVKALESFLRTRGTPPVNIRCLFDGEEEIGSPNLVPWLARHRRALASDLAVISDTRMLGPDRPAMTYSLRGSLGLELEVRGPRRDLHSGAFGGAVHNPLQALCEILARLHHPDGRVAVPGFYDRVRPVGPDERSFMARRGPSDARILRDAGVDRPWGEPGYSLHERTTIRPALTINGLSGGYQGPGGKAVIPASAVAKVGIRLVPDQDPGEISRLVRRHIARLAPPTVRVAVRTLQRARPVHLVHRHPGFQAAAIAYRRGFGTVPVLLRSGGTIPVVDALQSILCTPCILMGFALPDDRMHAPDEKLHLPTFGRAIATCIHFLAEVPVSLSYNEIH
ncbi:dipeptidase [Tautonia plasticadhaerens]|uniref:Succinyl-diaminopimelate desuccinylase n=1 Tax=Tautonia plasticadhaerens TaxID=2527974 RepID=A0A518H5U7_9BACT|nr:dipeptidase [Tautonia plasticadhaerens]QDV36211.1 Succinyl-diaminopimelate desuccinylase [Tautonia plasticadhaerens]